MRTANTILIELHHNRLLNYRIVNFYQISLRYTLQSPFRLEPASESHFPNGV
jgi:hypothetical protein